MRIPVVTTLLLVLFGAGSVNAEPPTAPTPLPDEISDYIARREHCQNMLPSRARPEELEKKDDKLLGGFCADINKDLDTLREKYRDDPEAIAKLSKYQKPRD